MKVCLHDAASIEAAIHYEMGFGGTAALGSFVALEATCHLCFEIKPQKTHQLTKLEFSGIIIWSDVIVVPR